MGRHEKQGSRAQKNHLDLDLVSSVVAFLGSKFMCHTGGSKGFASSAGLTCRSPVMCCCGQSLPPPPALPEHRYNWTAAVAQRRSRLSSPCGQRRQAAVKAVG